MVPHQGDKAMKAETTNRIQDAFRAGERIDSALKRAAAFAKKNTKMNAVLEKKNLFD
jgi:type II secretory pathway component PulF